MKPARLVALLGMLAGLAVAQTHHPRKPAVDPAPGPAPTSYTVENLNVEGNHTYSAEQIFAVAGTQSGPEGRTGGVRCRARQAARDRGVR